MGEEHRGGGGAGEGVGGGLLAPHFAAVEEAAQIASTADNMTGLNAAALTDLGSRVRPLYHAAYYFIACKNTFPL